MALTPQTAIRSTDISTESQYARLGNDANGLYDDLISRFHQALGFPIEITPAVGNGVVSYASSEYSMPDGTRAGILTASDSATGSITPLIGSGTINFVAGTISTGSNLSFAATTVPVGQWQRALIQYNPSSNALNVTYGPAHASLTNLRTGLVLPGYHPIYVVDLFGVVSVSVAQIVRANMLKVMNSFSAGNYSYAEENITVLSDGTVFNLATVTLPENKSQVLVFLNGVKQSVGAGQDLVFSSNTQLTFSNTIPTNAVITVRL